MMEALGKPHPDLVYAAYGAALDKVFGNGAVFTGSECGRAPSLTMQQQARSPCSG